MTQREFEAEVRRIVDRGLHVWPSDRELGIICAAVERCPSVNADDQLSLAAFTIGYLAARADASPQSSWPGATFVPAAAEV